jgi:hypothetical protein
MTLHPLISYILYVSYHLNLELTIHLIHVFHRDREPTAIVQRKKLKSQTLMDTLEDARGYVILTILIAGIRGGIHTNIITNLFDTMPVHACMQQIHLMIVKYLFQLMVNKRKMENHQQPLLLI